MGSPELKYIRKLVSQNICEEGMPLFGTLDDGVFWTSSVPETAVLEKVILELKTGSILFSDIAEPFRSMINLLAYGSLNKGSIVPDDTETRTFLHEIPVIRDFSPEAIAGCLKKRKGLIIPGKGIVTTGPVTPEQAFVTFSSICFSCYVKFMTDYYYFTRGQAIFPGNPGTVMSRVLDDYRNSLDRIRQYPAIKGPFSSGAEAVRAVIEAGALTIASGMVDSYFGNVSALHNECIYISQTGSSLDELEGCIDCCPMDNSSTCAITSSSEYSAHRALYSLTDRKTILHGHPKFSVIMSLLCDRQDCPDRGRCHIRCSAGRSIEDIPVVPGEIGTGATGLASTMPAAMKGRGVIVHGHGLFTAGRCDFSDSYSNLVDIEKMCFEKYVGMI